MSLILLGALSASLATGFQEQDATAQLEKSSQLKMPVFEVFIETSVKGEVERLGHRLSERELEELFLAGLENAGIRYGLTFVSRRRQLDRGDLSDRDRSGYYVDFPGGERGRFVRPTHRLQLTILLERTTSEEDYRGLARNIESLIGRDYSGITGGMRKLKERVFVSIRANVFDAVTNVSVGAVPRVEAVGEKTLVLRRGVELFKDEILRIFIFEIPIRTTQVKFGKTDSGSSRGLELSIVAIDETCDTVAVKLTDLAKKLGFTLTPYELALLVAESIGQDRKTVTFSGSIDKLKKGDILMLPLISSNREPRVGEEIHVFVKLIRIGEDIATGVVIDLETEESTVIDRGLVIDKRRLIRRA